MSLEEVPVFLYICILTCLNKDFNPGWDTIMHFHYHKNTFHDSGFSFMEREDNVQNSHGVIWLKCLAQSASVKCPTESSWIFLVIEQSTSPFSKTHVVKASTSLWLHQQEGLGNSPPRRPTLSDGWILAPRRNQATEVQGWLFFFPNRYSENFILDWHLANKGDIWGTWKTNLTRVAFLCPY